MANLKEHPFSTIQFYTTASYPCSYLEDQLARSQVATPSHFILGSAYTQLVQAGFRRSGLFTYRPHCDHCRACIPIRVKAREFVASRSQRRAAAKHANLIARVMPLAFHAEHYALYLNYQTYRHFGSGMDQDNREQYAQFLLQSKVDTRLLEFREVSGELRSVSVIDFLEDGLSSVYTFFDSRLSKNSYGIYSILWQIMQANVLGLSYVYLGYWIQNSRKMNYKVNFQPFEILQDGHWLESLSYQHKSS